jgi:hypothetical protein
MATFRPDGQGHICIADGVNPPEDIAFEEIVCDLCNGDAGADHADGSEGRIYFDGSDSLCESCGLKAEAAAKDHEHQELQAVRDTLRARGWPEERLAELSEGEVRDIAHDWRIDRAAGIPASKIAENLHWDVEAVTYFAARLLEEANVHNLAKTLFDSLEGTHPKEDHR